jgi:Lhr-like helicase
MLADGNRIIESNLNAIARTPLIHRDELRAHVRLPTLRTVTYGDKMNLLQSEEQQHIPYYSPEKKGEMSSLLERLQQGPEQHMARSQDQVREKRSFNSLLANLQQGPKVAKPLPPPKHSLGLSFDIDLGPEFTVPDFNVPGLATAVQAPPPHLSLTPSRDKRPKFQHTPPHVDDDDAEYESIDPETGETIVSRERPVTPTIVENDDKDGMDEDYEEIDPETGEAEFFGGIISNKRKSTAESTSSDECEEIDPETGEVITPRRRVPPPPSSRPRIQHSRVLESLRRAYETMDIMEDPWVIQQKKRNAMDLWETITNRKTYSQDQMRGFVRKAEYIFQECGEWATDWFISEVIRKFMYRETVLEDEDDVKVIGDMEPEEMYFGTRKEEAYVCSILQKIQIPKDLGPIEGRVSEKVDKLIDILLHEYSAEHRGFSGLVFVEQRVGAATIAKIISQHPRTRNLFKPGTMVGGSDGAFRKRRLISEIIVNLKQDNTLKDFRTGDKNLIIATAAIEEGLDVQDCHLVVCFDLPTNLKSFVQRRGRARREASSYVLMLDFNAPDRVATFEAMEQEMIKMYSDPDRELEEVEDEQEDLGTRCMKVEKTG